MEHVDVLVVGGGLIGLSLAAALRDSALKVTVVDQQPMPSLPEQHAKSREGYALLSGIKPGVSALGITSWTFLNKIAGTIPSTRYDDVEVWDSGTGRVDFGTGEVLGYIVENNRLVAALIEKVGQSIHWAIELTNIEKVDDGYRVCAGDLSWHTRLLVGADGSNSAVRKLVDLPALQWRYDQKGVVTTIETEKPHGNIARQWFTESGVLAFLPLADDHLCSIVYSTSDADDVLALDDAAFSERLGILSEQTLGPALGIDKRFSFPLQQQHSLSYVTSGLALIGDAAHTIHPLAGQGANLGLADAACLSMVIKQAKLEGRSPGDLALLKRYQRERLKDNVATATLMEILFRGFGSQNPGAKWLRSKGMKIVDDSPLLKSMIKRFATSR
ncbi:MAG: FAD-dependent oxidoreductase [Pseudomonadales bacterium]|nr:FAD-dependent oxidoreductase [Pseudomonadales bacterium]